MVTRTTGPGGRGGRNMPYGCRLECRIRNEMHGRSPLARGQKILRLGGATRPPNPGPAKPSKFVHSLVLQKGM
jgi:hypothetical protein